MTTRITSWLVSLWFYCNLSSLLYKHKQIPNPAHYLNVNRKHIMALGLVDITARMGRYLWGNAYGSLIGVRVNLNEGLEYVSSKVPYGLAQEKCPEVCSSRALYSLIWCQLAPFGASGTSSIQQRHPRALVGTRNYWCF